MQVVPSGSLAGQKRGHKSLVSVLCSTSRVVFLVCLYDALRKLFPVIARSRGRQYELFLSAFLCDSDLFSGQVWVI